MVIEVKPRTANIEVTINNDMLADQIGKLQKELAALEAEKARLNSLVAEMQGENAELQAEILRADNRINQLTEELNAAQGNNEALQTEINNLHLQITQLENQINVLNIEKEELQAQIDSTQAQIEGLQNQITQLSGDWDTLNGEAVENASEYALETKNAIAEAITSKGGTITEETTFRAYADEINNLSSKKTGDLHTLLLMHFTESAIKDDSINDCQFTVKGNPVISTEQSKFGGGSLYLDGASCLTFERNYFPFFTPEFTFEFWWYPPDDFSSSSRFCLFSQHGTFPIDANGTNGECFSHGEFYSNRYYQEGTMRDSRTRYYTAGLTTYGLKLKQWNHIAIVRNYGAENPSNYNYRLYVNGQSISWDYKPSSSYLMTTWTNYPSPWTLFAFKWESGGVARYLKGYINDLRISDVARYSGSSYTVPTEPFTI